MYQGAHTADEHINVPFNERQYLLERVCALSCMDAVHGILKLVVLLRLQADCEGVTNRGTVVKYYL